MRRTIRYDEHRLVVLVGKGLETCNHCGAVLWNDSERRDGLCATCRSSFVFIDTP